MQCRRDKLTIMLHILKNADEPIKKTHLLYKVGGLNFHELEDYLGMMRSVGLLNPVNEPFKGYHITEKGKFVLDIFQNSEAIKA